MWSVVWWTRRAAELVGFAMRAVARVEAEWGHGAQLAVRC